MRKFKNKKLASALLAMATLLGVKSGSSVSAIDSKLKQANSQKVGLPAFAKWLIGGVILGGTIVTGGIITNKVLKSKSESKDKDFEALLEKKLLGDSSEIYKEYENLPKAFRERYESGKLSQKINVFEDDNRKLEIKKRKEREEKQKQEKSYSESLQQSKKQNCEKIKKCMGEDFLDKLTNLYNKGFGNFSIKVYTKDMLDNKRLQYLWNNAFSFFCKEYSREIKNIKKVGDNAFKFDVPGLNFNDKQFIEIRLTGSGLQLSEFTDTHKIIAEFKLKNNI